MNKYYYDLHIHSTLSPCGDGDMTPNNIVNMAYIKQLDIIAVTDHNSMKHVEVIKNLASKRNITVIPGIEVETVEEVHLLCLFAKVEELKRFGEKVYEQLPDLTNDASFFGSQQIYDESDCLIDQEEKLLLNSTKFTIDELVKLVHDEYGIVFAAHIDKRANSIISNLGFIPEQLRLDGIEISNQHTQDEFLRINPQYRHYKILQNSDAHYLEDISERVHHVKLKDKSSETLIDHFRGEN